MPDSKGKKGMKKMVKKERERGGGGEKKEKRGKNSSKVRGNERHAKFFCERQQEQERSKTIAK